MRKILACLVFSVSVNGCIRTPAEYAKLAMFAAYEKECAAIYDVAKITATTDSNGEVIALIECGESLGNCLLGAGWSCPHGYVELERIRTNTVTGARTVLTDKFGFGSGGTVKDQYTIVIQCAGDGAPNVNRRNGGNACKKYATSRSSYED